VTTAGGPEMPGRPSLGQQVAALAARLAHRDPPASIGQRPDLRPQLLPDGPQPERGLVDATHVSGVEQPPDGGLVRLPPLAPMPQWSREQAWEDHTTSIVSTMNAYRPDPSLRAAVIALRTARGVLDQATILTKPAPGADGTVRPGSREQLAELFTQVGYLHAAIGELFDAMLLQIGSLHGRAAHGEVTAPPGADAFAEIEAIMRDVLALANNNRENTSRSDHGASRFGRLSWPSE
jgi:hypothetical protein